MHFEGNISMSSAEEFSHFFRVELDLFDGPIDLLLHLVKVNELPIEKISLAQVTQQYLECIDRMRSIDLDVAGEYLVMAATLLSIKSSVLLNEPPELVPDESGDLVDPHEELLRQLREAEIYKEGALHLEQRDFLGIDVFSPPSSLRRIPPAEVVYVDHSPVLLGKAFLKLLKEMEGAQALYTVTLESVSVVDRMMDVMEILTREAGEVPFRRLVKDITSRSSLIGTFIALLELCKRQAVVVRQNEIYGEITLALGTAEVGEEMMVSEFDEGALGAVQ